MRTFTIALAVVAMAATSAMGQEIKLKPGAGGDKAAANCQACHSLAYIPMNSPFLNQAGWNATVTKMVKVMGAPIDDADAKAIVEYLTKNYGS